MSQNSEQAKQDTDNELGSTPMYAVWVSLGFILLLGLYGLNLGMQARAKSKTTEEKPSAALVTPGIPAVTVEGRTLA